MTAQILQLGRLLPALEQALRDEFRVHRLVDEADQTAFLRERGADFTGLVGSAGIGASAEMMAALPSLRVISSFGVGLDKIDLAAAAARGIAVGYTPDVLNDCVADLAITLMLDVARRSVEADRFVRAGGWEAGGPNSFGLGRKVSGAKLGIVGLGRIGQTIARRVVGFDMQVRYHARRPVADAPWTYEPSLLELAAWCDYLVVIVAGGPATRHLINAEVLDALGPRGVLVNVARGSVVDEQALVQALQQGRIAGAGLDVFEAEPRVPAALMQLDRVVLLPHIASNTQETRQAMAERVLDNLRGFFRDGRLVSAAPLPAAA
ncbi:MAG TPA: 2-hydroxyacid dehydrogenase [Roseateles sp.]|nr:2-hydroxyacid dehydrogenase [Roseateles sp.]